MLKVRGFQVAPAELEGCILDHPDVTDTGELPLAFVVLRPEATKRVEDSPLAVDEIKVSIMKHVADNKVGYKKLAGGVEIVDIIPKNPSGKLLRRVLRDKAREMRTKPKAKL
ncbi:acetyl-CoA synthetase-like protein [Suillus decipiens]|nr:acetyl-CoA synthetase-like protein [Suillus decipiens]